MSDIGEVDGLSVRALAPLAALLGIWLAGIAAAALIHLPAAGLLLVLGVLIGGLVPWQVARGGAQREHLRAQQRTACARRRSKAWKARPILLRSMRKVPGCNRSTLRPPR